VASEVSGLCLDIGCGRDNLFIKKFLNGKGKGIDVFPYQGLKKNNIVKNLTKFPFKKNSFGTITFIATINHIPKTKRKIEINEAYRCLRPGGKIIITMGNPIAEILVHKLVFLYDKVFKTNFDVDTERGMHDETYFMKDSEIILILQAAGFKHFYKKFFISQWFLNHLFIAYKPI
jgi:SAM-dependent methyltransferase